MDPISISFAIGSVWGLLQATGKIIDFLSSLPYFPNTAANILIECHALHAIFTQVKDFISDQDQQGITRKSQTSLNYLVAALAGCVKALLELDKVLKRLGAPADNNDGSNYKFTFFVKLKWMMKENYIKQTLDRKSVV